MPQRDEIGSMFPNAVAHNVVSPDGTGIAVREFGDPAGQSILFIHGAFNASGCFAAQVTSPELQSFRLIAMDVRGHGDSGAPLDPKCYVGTEFAADVDTVIRSLGLSNVILVGWSLGGKILMAYLEHYGFSNVGGAAMVASLAFDEPFSPSQEVLEAVVGTFNNDETISHPAIRAFVQTCTARELSAEATEQAVLWCKRVPVSIRPLFASWAWEPETVLKRWSIPLLIVHGDKDAVFSHEYATRLKVEVPSAYLSIYPDVGHSPFAEMPQRFNAELSAFAASVRDANPMLR